MSEKRPSMKRVGQSGSGNIYGIIRWVLIVLFVVYLILSFRTDRDSNTDFSTMQSAVLAAADLTPMQEADNQMLRRLYGLDGNNYAGAMLYYPSTNMGAEELLLIKLSGKAQAEDVLAAMESRIASQKSSFEGYGVDQTAMLEKSICIVKGNYALLVSGENPEAVKAAFDAAY